MAIRDLVFIDATGFHYPDYPSVLASLQAEYKAIYGVVDLEADTQDGQWVAILASAIHDSIQVAAAVYDTFSPLTAQSDGLSRQVRINGIERMLATQSTVSVKLIGQNGTVITAGQVEDTNGNKWDLPASVTIPIAGEITVTATAATAGDISAAVATVTKIVTPTLGWQTVNNESAAVEGEPIETDAELRLRQSISTMIPSLSVMEGIVAAVADVSGVQRFRGYENDTNSTDGDGVPGHSIALVVEGGTDQGIADAIAAKKTAGTGTHGTTTQTTTDEFGVTTDIDFFRPTEVTIGVDIDLTALDGYVSTTADLIKEAVEAHINALPIGHDLYISQLYTPANLGNVGPGATFFITSIQVEADGGGLGDADLVIAFNELSVHDKDADMVINES